MNADREEIIRRTQIVSGPLLSELCDGNMLARIIWGMLTKQDPATVDPAPFARNWQESEGWSLFWINEESEVVLAESLEQAARWHKSLTGDKPERITLIKTPQPSDPIYTEYVMARLSEGITLPLQIWTAYA